MKLPCVLLCFKPGCLEWKNASLGHQLFLKLSGFVAQRMGSCCCDSEWEGSGACRGLCSDEQVLPLPANLSLFVWLPDSAMCRWLFGPVPHELLIGERKKGYLG